jgi:hypothetical protein
MDGKEEKSRSTKIGVGVICSDYLAVNIKIRENRNGYTHLSH